MSCFVQISKNSCKKADTSADVCSARIGQEWDCGVETGQCQQFINQSVQPKQQVEGPVIKWGRKGGRPRLTLGLREHAQAHMHMYMRAHKCANIYTTHPKRKQNKRRSTKTQRRKLV